MKIFISILFLVVQLFSQYDIEGRWHLVGYEDNVMYQFENNYRYSIYSIDGTFGGLEDAGGSPNPYTIVDDVITLDLFFGNIVSYQMNYLCDGQIVEFVYNPEGFVHSILFREGYDYINNDCLENSDDEGDFNSDNYINIVDIVILVNHILSPAAVELEGSDLNDDGSTNVGDVIFLIDMILEN